MFKFKKLFFLAALVAILATVALPGSPVFALSTRTVGFASVNQASVVTAQPASFRLRGTYTCDKVQVSSSVNGKVIDITVNNVKIVGGGNKCQTKQAFNRVVNVGILVPGKYTVYVNRASTGVAQKKFTFIAPLIAIPDPVQP